ncbi:hypothetical protein [Stenotrophomonas maltophilia]|uniref:hypothetical protein n=1 Tax=Stenotrophomonas maltophilia TaxID=40324 RepID=UPI001EF761B6|nr:hypothetical protein [Stenotrophomonas maltophilia]
MTLPALVLAALLQSGAGLMPDPDRPSPFPASDSEADIAAKIAELRAFFGSSERDTRNIVATAQQRALIERLEARHAARGTSGRHMGGQCEGLERCRATDRRRTRGR